MSRPTSNEEPSVILAKRSNVAMASGWYMQQPNAFALLPTRADCICPETMIEPGCPWCSPVSNASSDELGTRNMIIYPAQRGDRPHEPVWGRNAGDPGFVRCMVCGKDQSEGHDFVDVSGVCVE